MVKKMDKRSLKGKDLITIGIFAAIYFVLSLLCNILGGLGIIVWFFSPALTAIVCAVPYLVLCSKVKKPFGVLIMGIVVGLVYLATGQFHILLPITFGLMAIVAEIIRKITKYEHFWGDAVGFWFFSFGMVATPLPLWVDRDNFLEQIRKVGVSESIIKEMMAYVSPITLVLIFIGTFSAAIIGSFVAKGMFKKHFVKAGKV